MSLHIYTITKVDKMSLDKTFALMWSVCEPFGETSDVKTSRTKTTLSGGI